MGKARLSDTVVRNRDVKDALGDAFTRAVYWAPEPLLEQFATERMPEACRRLAMRVVTELAADGWREQRARMGMPGLEEILASGMRKAGKPILASLPHARCCDGKLLDGIGQHLGETVFKAMDKAEVSIERR